jgi:hypothetical protein
MFATLPRAFAVSQKKTTKNIKRSKEYVWTSVSGFFAPWIRDDFFRIPVPAPFFG